tara:strand:+ start:422 stop:658 length:237 start_codon:yes stop_codon:yes gene_type:complete
MKTITLTDKQFEQLKEYVVESCESIMERSLDWGDSDYADNIIDSNEALFEFRSILEDIEQEYEKKLEKARAKQPKAEW